MDIDFSFLYKTPCGPKTEPGMQPMEQRCMEKDALTFFSDDFSSGEIRACVCGVVLWSVIMGQLVAFSI